MCGEIEKMLIIKWKQDKEKIDPVYYLYICTENNIEELIGWVGWDDINKYWIANYEIPSLKSISKKYESYNINEVNDVLFRMILDVQNSLVKINNMCVNYCNAISDYIIDYIQGIDHNED